MRKKIWQEKNPGWTQFFSMLETLISMASPSRLSTRRFGVRKPAQVRNDAALRHSPPFRPGA
jgi:hypothetical protein